MNQGIKANWLDALRSGKYKQGQYWLRKEDLYCCLGVLCDIHGAKWEHYGDGVYEVDGYNRVPPYEFKAGLDSYEIGILAEMNDRKMTFEAIAKYIEENL